MQNHKYIKLKVIHIESDTVNSMYVHIDHLPTIIIEQWGHCIAVIGGIEYWLEHSVREVMSKFNKEYLQ